MLVALLSLSSWCLVNVVWLFLAVSRVCLQFVIVIFPYHSHILFLAFLYTYNTIQYNTIQLFYCFISFHMRHSQNTYINMFNINTKNDISFSIMLNKRSI